jgi:hypothetical protein
MFGINEKTHFEKELAFYVVDSQSIRWFCRIGIADKGFKKSVLNKNIKAIAASTWKAINQEVIGYAEDQKISQVYRNIGYITSIPDERIPGGCFTATVRQNTGNDWLLNFS